MQQDCEYDSLSLSSKLGSGEIRKHGVFCGSRLPPVITSEGNSLRLEFNSDNSVQKSGFAAVFFTGEARKMTAFFAFLQHLKGSSHSRQNDSSLMHFYNNQKVSLYCWPPVCLVWNQLYDNWQFLVLFAKQTNSNQSNRRSTVQWYFPPLIFPDQYFRLGVCYQWQLLISTVIKTRLF